MKRLYLALILLVLAAWPAHAQPVTVIGPITPGDCAYFNSVTILKDAGFQCNGSFGGTVPWANITGTPTTLAGYGITGAQTLSGGPLTINPPAASITQGLIVNQTGNNTSSTAGVSNNCAGQGQPGYSYNSICTLLDGLNVTAGNPPYTYGFSVGMTSGGTNSQGTKIALSAEITHTIASAPSAVRDNIAMTPWCLSSASEGGTNTGAGAAGDCFGINPLAHLLSGATNYFDMSAGEADCQIESGASARYGFCWSIVAGGSGSPPASLYGAVEIGSATGTAQFKTALLLDNVHGFAPLGTTGCVICTDGSTDTIATGIDLSAYTISGNFLNSVGFAVTGAGAVGLSSSFGSAGQCIKSGGGSGTADIWGNCTGSGVPQNNLNTQSGNYSIPTTDCGNTINATGAQKTITLPAVAGFVTNCVLAVYNASSTRGQILSGFPGAVAAAPSNILWPLDTITVQIVNGAWSIQSYVNRHKLTAAITVFVDVTNGNDANDCLAATTGACATRQGAFNYINTWDGNEQAILVSVAAGTYTANLTQNGPFHGNPTVTLQGDLSTPSNVLISTTSADALDMSNGAALTMGGFKIVTTTGGNGINVINASFLNITGAMEYGANAGVQIRASAGSTITITANYTISGGASIHWQAIQAAQIFSSGSRTVTLSGTPAFSTAFTTASTGGVITANGTTFSGSGTGPSFAVSTNSIVNNPSASVLPGSLITSTVATHGYASNPGTPGISSCGTSPSAATGTDFSGRVTEGTTATGCTITFSTGSTFNSCNVSLSTGAAVGISTLGATLVVTHASLSSNVLYWTCAN
jgi:hypothetical protein